MAEKNNINLKINTYLKGKWFPIDEEMFVQIDGIIYPIVDYACMIDGVWRYAPRSSYVWEKYSVKEIKQDFEWSYDESIEERFEIKGPTCMPSDIYRNIGIDENGDIYGIGEYRLGELIGKDPGGFYYDGDGNWYYIDGIWHYVWDYQKDKYDPTKYNKIYETYDNDKKKRGPGFLLPSKQELYSNGEKIGYVVSSAEGTIDCYPIEVEGGSSIEKIGSPIENVYADSRIYPIDGLHSDGYWYTLIKCPYIWNKYSVQPVYNWSVYNAVSSSSKYEAYLKAVNGTVTKLLDIIKINYNNNEKAYCDDILDSKDIVVVKNLHNVSYKLSYLTFSNRTKFYKGIWFNTTGNIQGTSQTYFARKNVYVNITLSSPEIKAGWYYLIGQNSKGEYCLYSLSAQPKGKSEWVQGSSLIKKVSSTDINAYPPEGGYKNGYYYQREEDTNTKTFIEKVESNYNGPYPKDGQHTDGYWYTLVMTGK